MFTVDMVGRTETDLERIIADRCSRFGPIANVRVVRLADTAGFAVALVRMANPRALDALLADLGGARSNATAIIELSQAHVLN